MLNVKKKLKFFGNEFVYGGHLISLAACGIITAFILIINKPISLPPLVIIYSLVFSSLFYNRYKEETIDYLSNPKRTQILEKYFKYILIIILSSFLLGTLILIQDDKIYSLVFITLWYLAMIFYTLYFKKLTAKIIGFKNIYCSLGIAMLLLFISYYYSYNFLNLTFLLIFLFTFLRMMVNTVFSDIKDIESDKKHNLKTFPALFGYQKTIFFLKVITIVSGLLLIIGFYQGLLPIYSLMLLFVIPYSFYYFGGSERKKSFYLINYILVDIEFILWPISIIIGKNILL